MSDTPVNDEIRAAKEEMRDRIATFVMKWYDSRDWFGDREDFQTLSDTIRALSVDAEEEATKIEFKELCARIADNRAKGWRREAHLREDALPRSFEAEMIADEIRNLPVDRGTDAPSQ